jgi:hypothetical protein
MALLLVFMYVWPFFCTDLLFRTFQSKYVLSDWVRMNWS